MNTYSEEIWKENYKAENENTIQDTWKRLAKEAAKIEKPEKRKQIFEQFYYILEDFKFIPGGRIMANLGINSRHATTLFNCYVHHPKDINYKDPDSIEGIYTMLKAQAHTLKSEGGYGMNFSWIRPAGSYIKGIGSRSPGVIKFMELWDKSSEIITMGSEKILGELRDDEKIKIRKGAQMAVLSVWHPEIEDFIVAKQTPGRLTKFNISVGITEGFMEAVRNNKDWNLIFPNTEDPHYNDEWNGDIDEWISKKYRYVVHNIVKARKLWDKIIQATYTRNEPGVIFLDVFNKLNPLAYGEKIFTTNPCGEIGMSTGVCNLGSINLPKFVKKTNNNELYFDFDEYANVVKIAIRFLDNINDISRTPLEEYTKSTQEKRRIGLGNMGLGSMLLMFGIRYGSEESQALVEKIYKLKAETEILASAELGKEKGSFKLFNKQKYFSTYWWNNLKISPEVKKTVEKIGCMRNSHRSMNAPTGNTGIFAGVVSGGIEPVFLLEYTRWMIVNEQEKRNLAKKGFKWANPLKGEWFETEHMKFSYRGDEQILKGTFEGVEYEVDKNRGLVKAVLVEDYGWSFLKSLNIDLEELRKRGSLATTQELSVNEHINILKIVAHYTDMNNSKTVNIPKDYPYDSFKSLYFLAWENNIKGITTYRDGTMTAVLETQQKYDYQNELEKQFAESGGEVIKNITKIPEIYFARGFKIKDSNKKKWYVNVAFVDKNLTRPYAIFVSTNNNESTEVTEDLIHSMEKLLIEKGISKELVEEQIKKYQNQKNTTRIARIIGMALRHNLKIEDIVQVLDNYPHEVSSFVFHLKKILALYIKNGVKIKEKCPSCKSNQLEYQDGCKMCTNCGWSLC